MMPSYHNTNQLAGAELVKAIGSATSQEARILRFFQRNPNSAYSSEEVQHYCTMKHRPLTSVRRALSNLAHYGCLRKTDSMKMGKYGKPIHLYTLVEKTGEQVRMF